MGLCRWSGLIRGAVSVALVYYHFDPRGKSEDSKRATLITTTLLVVLFSILVCGALTKPLLLMLLEPQGAPLACITHASAVSCVGAYEQWESAFAALTKPLLLMLLGPQGALLLAQFCRAAWLLVSSGTLRLGLTCHALSVNCCIQSCSTEPRHLCSLVSGSWNSPVSAARLA